MARSIKLAWATSPPVSGKIGVRVRMQASEAVNMDPNVFAYLMRPLNPATGTQAGYFDHVCNVVDLTDYPIGGPAPASRPSWFRLDWVDITVATEDIALNFINLVRADVQDIKTQLDNQDELGHADYEVIAGEPEVIVVSSSLTL